MRPLTLLSAIVLTLANACASKTANDPHVGASGDPAAVSSELVARFDTAAGELPEGLAVHRGSAFVGFAPTSRIVRVDLETGLATPFGQLPVPVSGKGFMTGLAVSAQGEVYAGLASFVPEVQAGIYRISPQGGAATLFAKDDALPFTNALAFDGEGTLWATDSGTGSVFRIDASGRAERWASGETLMGNKDACGGAGPGFAIGANGMIVERDAVYVVNLDQATLVKIPRGGAGNAGAPSILAGPDCDALGGADGLLRAKDGSFLVTVNRQDQIVRISATGAIETIASGTPLDFPATLAYGGDTLYVTNFALRNASAGNSASPGLVRLSK